MESELTKEEYQKKINRCKRLGAEWFQQIVFKVEKLKFKVLKNYFPNAKEKYEKSCDRKCKKALRKAKTESEKRMIIANFREQKLMFGKELNREQNRNYHLDMKNPKETLGYLKWNKRVHQEGLITDLIVLPILVGVAVAGFPVVLPFVAIETLSAFINFECINIQDYNIYRFKQKETQLKKIAERKQKKEEEKCGEAIKVIAEAMQEKEKTITPTALPTVTEIINGAKSKEQLLQLRAMAQREIRERQIQRGFSQNKEGGNAK